MILPYAIELTFPLENPVVKFLLILVVILLAPLLLNRIKIPPLLGLIIAGALIGPHGLNLIERDNGIILSGTAGLLYIMFLAGLEIDLGDFKKNSKKSLVFGGLTFLIPMTLGILVGYYGLGFSMATTVLLASMFASHTLIAYPLISKMGIAKNRAVNVAVGGTIITDTLALLVLAVVVGMVAGEVGAAFWIRLIVSLVVFGLVVILIFPPIARWFLKKFDDSVSQYIFILTMVFLGAVLAELAGIEAIIGAFLTGLALNRLIPRTSPLMNRVEFVGNAIFIPFFLIGVGMLIDYKAFFGDVNTLKVGAVMVIVATSAKFLAAYFTQKIYGFSRDERRLIFGLSNAQAAATLAAVLVGYNIILGETENGEPIRLLNESILNGTILMILVTCTIASFVAQKGARNVALAEMKDIDPDKFGTEERILIPVSNSETTEELISLALAVKSRKNKRHLYALNIISTDSAEASAEKKAQKILQKATVSAAAADNLVHQVLRYDLNVTNGIMGVVKEQKITDIILGLHVKQGISDTFLGDLTEGILSRSNTTTLIYKSAQPLGTLKRHLVIVPEKAEREIGFAHWVGKLQNLARNTGAKMIFYASGATRQNLKEILSRSALPAEFMEADTASALAGLRNISTDNDNLIIVMSRKDKQSYHPEMANVSRHLNEEFQERSFMLVYPMQEWGTGGKIDFQDPSFRP